MAEIIGLPYGLFQSVCYLIRLAGQVVLIDPCIQPSRLPADLPPVSLMIATHGHIDHICQADDLRQATGAPLLIHSADQDCLTDADRNLSATFQHATVYQAADECVTDGQILQLDSLHALEILHTPGHSPGCVCLLLLRAGCPVALFSGDTLFAGSIGRLDLAGDPAAMQRSLLRLRLLAQRPGCFDIPVYPGHGPVTTLRRESMDNPYFKDFFQ